MRQPSPRVTLAEMPLPRPPSSPLNPQGSQGLQAPRLASEALPTRCAWGRGWSPAAGGGRSGAATRAKGTGYQGRECSELPALLVLLPLRKPQEALGPKLPGLHRGRLRSHSRLGPSQPHVKGPKGEQGAIAWTPEGNLGAFLARRGGGRAGEDAHATQARLSLLLP